MRKLPYQISDRDPWCEHGGWYPGLSNPGQSPKDCACKVCLAEFAASRKAQEAVDRAWDGQTTSQVPKEPQ